ncbi:MAG: hypothetical protein ABUL44_03890, partial [Flavobacterium sp.]
SLFSIGWNTNDSGKIIFLANDDFEWQSDDIENQQVILKLLYEIFLNNQFAGIALMLPNLTGGSFHFLPGKNDVMILLNINRVKFEKMDFTDYSYYLDKLYPVIKGCTKLNYCDIL